MKTTIEITNSELYNEKVENVELDFHRGEMNGDVAIEVVGEGERVFTGEHGANDYEDEYGFIIIRK
jgi:hypothetical protein